MDEGWLSITEIAQKTSIPKTTIRRYFLLHGRYLQLEKQGKGYMMAEQSIPIIKKIRESYDAGKQTEEVEESLLQLNIPITSVPLSDDSNMDVTQAETITNMANNIIELKETIEKQKELLSDVVHMLGRTYKEKEDEIKKLNQQIDMLESQIQVMKEAEEARKQVATTKKTWIKKWFLKKQ